MLKNCFPVLLLVLVTLRVTAGASLPPGFTETAITGLFNPTAMEFAPDGRIFVCQQSGSLRVIKNGVLLTAPFVTLNVDANGERGLLGVAFDPNFATNKFLYLYYTVATNPIHNRVSRFTANGDVAAAGSETIILELDNLSSATNHNGGAIHFGPDGKLYPLAVEFVGKVPGFDWLTEIVVRLPDNLPAGQSFLVSATLHGTTTNKVRFRMR